MTLQVGCSWNLGASVYASTSERAYGCCGIFDSAKHTTKKVVDTDQLERAMGIEPTTPTLARSCSTAELHPRPGGLMQ